LVAVLLYNARAMARVVGVWPAGFWYLWFRLAVGVVVVGRNDYVVEVVGVLDDEGFGYVGVMVVVGVVVYGGFGQAELPSSVLTNKEYRVCIASLEASLAPY
jgi:hypothetical protein